MMNAMMGKGMPYVVTALLISLRSCIYKHKTPFRVTGSTDWSGLRPHKLFKFRDCGNCGKSIDNDNDTTRKARLDFKNKPFLAHNYYKDDSF